MARPTKYTPEIAKRICELIAVSDCSLDTLLSGHDDLPDDKTVYRWLAKYDTFCDLYAQAREQQAAFVLDQVPEIADDGRNDWMEKRNREGEVVGWVVNGEAVARSKLRVETRFKLAEKLNPKKFGHKQDVNLNGTLNVSAMTEDEIAAEIAALAGAGVIPLSPKAAPATGDDYSDLA